MRTSPTTAKLNAAIAAAQKNMKNPVFDRVNSFFSTSTHQAKYATLAATRDAVIPALAAEGVAVTQERSVRIVDWQLTAADGTSWTDRRIQTTVTTRLACGEEWLETDTVVYAPTEARGQDGRTRDMLTPQGIASAGTYACRYALQAACVVVGDDDDDANSASVTPDRQSKAAPKEPPTAADLRAMLASMPAPPDGATRDEALLAWVSWSLRLRVSDLDTLDAGQIAAAMSAASAGRMPADMAGIVTRWRASDPAVSSAKDGGAK